MTVPGRALPGLLCGMTFLLPHEAKAADAPAPSEERQFEFNASFLRGGSRVDVSRYARGNPVLPGDYLVDLQVNGKWVSRETVRFIGQPGSDVAQPCIARPIFDRIGVDLEKLSGSARARLQEAGADGCLSLGQMIEDAAVSFEMSTLSLDISVPQVAMMRAPRDFVGPQYWDEGVPSATMGYNLHAYRSTSAGRSTTRGHVDFQTGLNYSSWHLRQRMSIDAGSGESVTFQSVAAYVTHDIPAVRGNLIIGENFTDGAVFGSFGFRGISLVSSDQMLPDSRRDFAPVVRGVARTNARVVISQNGVNILETTVSPGTFEINDLYATGYGGDLTVAIHEADGSRQEFVVPWSPLPQLMRPGVWRYNVTAGSLDQPSSGGSENFLEGTLQHGFNSLITGYAGGIGAEHYRALLLGVALNTRAGALSADVTQTRASLVSGEGSVSGQEVRLSYSKMVRRTQTDITLAAYPFISQGHYSLTEAMSRRAAELSSGDLDGIQRPRRQWQVTINQNLPGRWGDFFLAGSVRDFWHSRNTLSQLQAGYTNQLRLGRTSLSYGISVAKQEDVLSGEQDKRIQMNFSLPLGRSRYSPSLSTSFVEETRRGQRIHGSQQVLIGSLGQNHQFSYSLAGSQTSAESSYTANGQYRGANTSVAAGISKGSGYTQQSLGATGGLVVHPGGVTLANQMTDTFGIVEAVGAEGARVTNSVGTVINRSGYAVIPFLLPYRMNTITIDPAGAVSADVEFRSTTALVAPRLNSVVVVRFGTVEGRAILVTARLPDGSEVPFGASVFDRQGGEVGLVGQNGRIYLRGIEQSGTLTARWGDAADERCEFDYEVPSKQEGADPFVRLEATCRLPASAVQ